MAARADGEAGSHLHATNGLGDIEAFDEPGLLTIGQLAEQTGVRAATLRAWEQRFGFPEPARSPGGQRRYPPAEVGRVVQVVRERAAGLELAAAVAAARRIGDVGTGSLFAQTRADHPHLDVMSVGIRVMKSLAFAIEDECLAHASRPLLLGCFQDVASFRRSGRRWRALSRSAHRAIVFSDFERTDASASPSRVALPPASPMLNEWSLVVTDPQLSVALIAWERPRPNPRMRRTFEGLFSLEPAVVDDAARRLLAVAESAGLSDAGQLATDLRRRTTEDPRRSESLLRRFVKYADA